MAQATITVQLRVARWLRPALRCVSAAARLCGPASYDVALWLAGALAQLACRVKVA